MARKMLGADYETVDDLALQGVNSIILDDEVPEFDNEESNNTNPKKDLIKNTDYDVAEKKHLYKNLTTKNLEMDKTDDKNLNEKDYSPPYIPIEIISLILDRVNDGETLLNCTKVSDIWRSLITSSTKSGSNRWMNICIKEIPKEQFFDFLGNHEPKYWMEEVPTLDFFYIYSKWSHWCKFIEMNKTFKKLCYVQNKITCIKTSGDWILISSKDCTIYAYSFAKHTLTSPILRCGHVKSLHLRCNQVPGNQANKLPGIGHDELIINLNHPKTTRFNLHDFKETYLDKVTLMDQLIAFENVEINLTVRNRSTIFKATFMNGKIVIKTFETVCTLISVWNGFVIAFCHNSCKMMIMDYYFNEIKHPFNNKIILEKEAFPSAFFGMDTFVAVAPSPCFPIPFQVHHLDCVKMYSSIALPIITCVRLYGSHLFLGTAYGSLRVYRIEKITDLLNLEHLESDRREIITVCSQGHPIIAIDIHESKNKSSLIVATEANIVEISF